jgi:hypothetical protein
MVAVSSGAVMLFYLATCNISLRGDSTKKQVSPLRSAWVGMTHFMWGIRSMHVTKLSHGMNCRFRKLAAVVGGGLGVDEEAADFGAVEFEGAF